MVLHNRHYKFLELKYMLIFILAITVFINTKLANCIDNLKKFINE